MAEDNTGEKTTYRQRRYIPPALRKKIIARDGKCLMCGSTEDLTVDHIKAVDLGGQAEEDNLQTLCRSCNSKKNTAAIDARAKPIYVFSESEFVILQIDDYWLRLTPGQAIDLMLELKRAAVKIKPKLLRKKGVGL